MLASELGQASSFQDPLGFVYSASTSISLRWSVGFRRGNLARRSGGDESIRAENWLSGDCAGEVHRSRESADHWQKRVDGKLKLN